MRVLITIVCVCCVTASVLAAEFERGKAIFTQKCASCHKLPVTGTRTERQWSLLVEIMQQTMANKGVTQLSALEQRELLSYLASTAPSTSSEATTLAKATFTAHCALCHQLPEPTMLRPKQWQAILITMQTRMQQAGIPPLTQAQTDLILDYLSQAVSE